MTEKDIREAIAGLDPEINKLTGEPILLEEKPKPIRLPGDIRQSIAATHFRKTWKTL